MHHLLSVFLLLIPLGSLPQSPAQPENQVLYLTKQNGDTIEIVAQSQTNYSDTVFLTVNAIKNKKRRKIQQFKTLFSYPLEVKTTSIDNRKGIFVTFDPAERWRNAFLYLFHETKNCFLEVKGIRELGTLTRLSGSRGQFFYSYISCGCADNCWVSKMFTIKDYKVQIIAPLSCDCSRLTASHSKTQSTCAAYNNKMKFETIDKYWKNVIKKGL